MEDGLLTGLTTDDEESIRTALQSSHPKSKIITLSYFLISFLASYSFLGGGLYLRWELMA